MGRKARKGRRAGQARQLKKLLREYYQGGNFIPPVSFTEPPLPEKPQLNTGDQHQLHRKVTPAPPSTVRCASACTFSGPVRRPTRPRPVFAPKPPVNKGTPLQGPGPKIISIENVYRNIKIVRVNNNIISNK